jgi:RNA polymerase sigma-70 factor (ECF subfamily)
MPDDSARRINSESHDALYWYGKRGYLRALCSGDKQTWDAFVIAAAPLVAAVARRTLAANKLGADLLPDAVQHVFVRLSANDCRLLKDYDPARATIASWLAVTSWSSTAAFVRDGAARG